jgi:Bacterial Ig-like domain (group 3)
VSLKGRAGQHKNIIIGLGVVAVSLFGMIAPAAAVGTEPSHTKLGSSTPTVGIGGIGKLKAVITPSKAGVTLLPTGTVTFREGAATTGTVTLATVSLLQTAKLDVPGLAVGTHTFIATYNGDATYATSVSLPVTITVGKNTTTTTGNTGTPSIGPGDVAKLKAVVKQASGTITPTGTVTFREGTTIAGTVTLALEGTLETARLDVPGLGLGTHTFVATYNGSTSFETSVSAAITVAVGTSPTTTTLTSNPAAPLPGKQLTLKAVVQQDSGVVTPTGTVTYVEGTTTLGTEPVVLLGTTPTAKLVLPSLPLGTHVITATYSGSSTFDTSTDTLTVSILKIDASMTLTIKPGNTNPNNKTMKVDVAAADTALTPAPPAPTGLMTLVLDTNAPQVQSLLFGATSIQQVLVPGSTHTLKVTYAGDTIFNGQTKTFTFTV